ncbi:MAG TPA: hypothetical protein VGD00_07180 [Solirubrobacteraceae bacterium]
MRRATRHLWLLALLAALVLAVPAADAQAGCGGVRYMPAKKKPKHGRAPLAIGDSTMLLAMDNLAKIGFNVNAHGCRGMDEGLAILRKRGHDGTLPHLVVMALGTDFSVKRSQIKRALRYLGPDRVLGLVTPWELGGHAGSDAKTVRKAGKTWKDRVKVLDWVKVSRGHGSWFQPDGCHLTQAGARAFARLFKKALPYAQPPPPPAA